jgi:hypothetical protein
MSPDALDSVTRMLRERIADAGDVDALTPARDAAVAALAEALRARARTKRRRRRLSMLAAAAGVAVVLGGGGWGARRATLARDAARDLGRVVDPSGSVLALRDGHAQPIGQGLRVAEGTELRTGASSEARLDFDSGTRVTVGGAARVRLVEQSRHKRFALEAGTLFAKVAKLGSDDRFVVTTPDAEVEVHGTVFRVTIVPPDPSCAGGSPTRLEVTEGVVALRQAGVEHRIGAGERWPVCASTSVEAAAVPSVTRTLAMTPPLAGTSVSSRASGVVPTPEPTSHLTEQNDLFDQAMRLKRGGDATAATAKLDRLLAVYPGGPHAESAAVERMRLLSSTNDTRAPAAAREYLKHHPRGFARAEAEAIAAERR